MIKAFKYVVIAFVGLLLVAQLIRPNITNPPVDPAERLETSVDVPADIAAILKRSCNDCHTNETAYPWYSQITPVNWWLKNHIDHGREHLNFSTWARYTPNQKEKRLEEVCEVLESGEMPLPSYLWGHRDAVLSADDAKKLCEWALASKPLSR